MIQTMNSIADAYNDGVNGTINETEKNMICIN